MKAKNNLDNLINQKLSEEAFEFKESYWANAQQVIAAQQQQSKRKIIWLSLISALLLVGSFSASYAWYTLNNEPGNQVNSSKTILIQEQTKAIVKEDISEEKNTITKVIKANKNTEEADHFKRHNPIETEIQPSDQLVRNDATGHLVEIDDDELIGESIHSINIRTSEDNEDNFILEPLPYLPTSIENSVDQIELKSIEDKVIASARYKELNLGFISTMAKGTDQDRIAHHSLNLTYQLGLGKSWLIGTGVEFSTTHQKLVQDYLKLVDKEVADYESIESIRIIENEQLVPGYVFIDGVAFNAMVPETFYDTITEMRIDTSSKIVSDSMWTSNQINRRAQYVEIPIQLQYIMAFGKFDLRFGINGTAGYRLSNSINSTEPIFTTQINPELRFKVGATINGGYFINENWSIQVGGNAVQMLNGQYLKSTSLGGNVGLRYIF